MVENEMRTVGLVAMGTRDHDAGEADGASEGFRA